MNTEQANKLTKSLERFRVLEARAESLKQELVRLTGHYPGGSIAFRDKKGDRYAFVASSDTATIRRLVSTLIEIRNAELNVVKNEMDSL